MVRTLMAILCCAVVSQALQLAHAADAPRQQYGKWQHNKEKNYYYREYTYKVKPTDTTYKKQYVIYYKNDKKVNNNWVYYYNPETKKVWCRYPTTNNPTYGADVKKGKELWSVLPKEKRQQYVYDTKADDYGKVGVTCPVIPEAPDNATMAIPPSDLP